MAEANITFSTTGSDNTSLLLPRAYRCMLWKNWSFWNIKCLKHTFCVSFVAAGMQQTSEQSTDGLSEWLWTKDQFHIYSEKSLLLKHFTQTNYLHSLSCSIVLYYKLHSKTGHLPMGEYKVNCFIALLLKFFFIQWMNKFLSCSSACFCMYLFLRPVPLPRLPPTRVCRDGRAERLSCCLLGPLRPPGMVASYQGNQGRRPPTNSCRDSSPSPQWTTMYRQATVEENQQARLSYHTKKLMCKATTNNYINFSANYFLHYHLVYKINDNCQL